MQNFRCVIVVYQGIAEDINDANLKQKLGKVWGVAMEQVKKEIETDLGSFIEGDVRVLGLDELCLIGGGEEGSGLLSMPK